VRATGGLADTVVDCSEEALADGEATGFVFEDYDAAALVDTVRRAVQVYEDEEKWGRLQANDMKQDWSWKRSAREYEDVYEAALDRRDGD
jgi:starch synthase